MQYFYWSNYFFSGYRSGFRSTDPGVWGWKIVVNKYVPEKTDEVL